MFLVVRNLIFISKRFTSEVAKAMTRSNIIFDVIEKGPKETAEIIYPCGDKVELGNELKPKNVKDKPSVKWSAKKNRFYTLCMVDPDAPSPKEPTQREWQHWLVGNIPGMKVHKGETLSEYIGSAPPKGTGLHRYVFLIYEQNSKLTFGCPRLINTSAENRGGFCIRNFMAVYNLGNPVAGNFYRAQYDDYVPIIYKRLGV